MILRCTKKLLTVIGSRQLIDRTPDGEDWYANLLWLSGRKCLLITHAATLFTVFEADVPDARAAAATLAPFWDGGPACPDTGGQGQGLWAVR